MAGRAFGQLRVWPNAAAPLAARSQVPEWKNPNPSPWAELFLAAVDDLLATSYGEVNDVADKSAGKLPTSRVVSCRVVTA